MDTQAQVKQRLVKHLKGGQAFSTIEKVLDNMPFDKIGTMPDGLPYSFYQQFYHIRIAQLDILEYCRDDNYRAPDWPDDYWPKNSAPADENEWQALIDSYNEERSEFCELLLDPSKDLLKPFESNKDHNLLRQAELIIEHTAYHTGQLFVMYRLVGK